MAVRASDPTGYGGTEADTDGLTRKGPKALSKPVPSATRPPLQLSLSEELNPLC